jgi:hypothetical protein
LVHAKPFEELEGLHVLHLEAKLTNCIGKNHRQRKLTIAAGAPTKYGCAGEKAANDQQ